MGAGWRLSHLSWFIALLYWWQFVASMAWVMRTLVQPILTFMSVCTISFVDMLLFTFDSFGGMCGENLCTVFLLLFIVHWVPIFVMLSKRAMPKLWHASLFVGLS
jgi:hypothetical protein